MGFSPFNHYYALFAELSSALVAIEGLRALIGKTLVIKLDKIKKNIDISIDEILSRVIQLKKIIEDFIAQENYVVAGKYMRSIRRRKKAIKSLTKQQIRLNKSNGSLTIQKKLIALHVYVFMFSLFMLIVAAFSEDKYIEENTAFGLVWNCEFLSVISIAFLLIYMTEKVDYSGTFVALGLFLLVLLLSGLLTMENEHPYQTTQGFIITISLIICATPLILLVFYSFIRWYAIEVKCKFKLWNQKRIIKRESKKMADDAMKL